MTLEISIEVDSSKLKEDFDGLAEQFKDAFEAAKNIAASMIQTESEVDIRNAGNFGDDYVEGLEVEVTDDEIITTLDAPGASIFEEGGEIDGNPLLWLPFSGSDAEGTEARDYAGKLFSVTPRSGGHPMLFSAEDKEPKYFGIDSVTIPKKFHLGEIQLSVMESFDSIFQNALDDNNG